MLSINTNLSGLVVQSNLKASTNGLNTAIERMTSGFRINHAKDNAANYSISTKLSSQISAYEVAEDNAFAGLDMLTTATENLDLITSYVQRLRDLAEQASNGTYGQDSLNAINSEANAIVDEIERIYNKTEYNSKVLFGEEKIIDYYVPDISINDIDLNNIQFYKGYVIGIANAEDFTKLADVTNGLNGMIAQDTSGLCFALTSDIDLSELTEVDGSNWTAIGTTDNTFKGIFNGNGYIIKNLKINKETEECQGLFGKIAFGAILKNINLVNCYVKGVSYVGGVSGDTTRNSKILNCKVSGQIISLKSYCGGLTGALTKGSAIENCSSQVIVEAVTGKSAGGLVGELTNGSTIYNSFSDSDVKGYTCVGGLVGCSAAYDNIPPVISNCWSNGSITASFFGGAFVGGLSGNSFFENCSYNNTNNASFNAYGGDYQGTVTDFPIIDIKIENPISEPQLPTILMQKAVITTFQVGITSEENSSLSTDLTLSLNGLSVLRYIGKDSFSGLSSIDRFLSDLNEKRVEYGSAQNRLESVLDEISIKRDNLVSTQSTIRDADIAEESSAYIRNQILQQASATLLATANQTPAIALQLL